MATQMTFGGSPCPSLWGIISESLTYLSNAIIQNRHWDHDTLFDSISDELNSPLSLPDSIPFHPAKELAVTLPPNDLGKVNIYIDDSIGVTPDINNKTSHVSQAIPLAIRTLARPLNPSDIIPRKDIISSKNTELKDGWKNRKLS
jgi:hypothetical protein